MARQKDDPQIARLYGRLLPLIKSLWRISPKPSFRRLGSCSGKARMIMTANSRSRLTKPETEVSLRLIGSDTMRNGFIEAGINNVKGFFWLYACRAGGNMIRFGLTRRAIFTCRSGKTANSSPMRRVPGNPRTPYESTLGDTGATVPRD